MKKQEKSGNKKNLTKKDNTNIPNKKNIIISVVVFFVVAYLLYTIYLLIKQPTNIFTVEEGKLYQEETCIGYVIRDEKVVKGENYKNGMEQIKAEGERASTNENIFRYYSANEDSLKQKVAELDVKIQEIMTNDKSILTADMKILENQIEEKIAYINRINDITKLVEYKKEIDSLVAKKAKIAGESSPQGSYLKDLIEQRKEFENQLNSGAEYVKAPMSGLVSYKVDGLEEILTPNNFGTLSEEYLESLNLKTGKIIATNEECGKVIDNFSCYIATIIETKEGQEAEVGKKIKVRLSNNVEVPAQIVSITNQENGKKMLIIQLNKQIEELINYRKITFDLIWWVEAGLKVPNQAIIKIDGLDYVVRSRAGYSSKILVKVKKQSEKYSIVTFYSNEELKELGFTDKQIDSYKKITIYDEIIVNPDLSKLK